MLRILFATSTIALMSTSAALAQQEEMTLAFGEAEIAEECLNDLMVFSQQVAEEGYWFSGFRAGWGWRGYGTTPGVASEPVPAPDSVPPVPDPEATVPWAAIGWQAAPGHELRSLQNAAVTLARRGDAEGCELVSQRLQMIYNGYVEQLQEAGVQPGDVVAWREQQIVSAIPVDELGQMLSIDWVTGTDLRNLEDEQLGSIEDGVMGPEGDELAYAIVGHGGFLGFRQEHVAVPWDMLLVTPGVETFILDVPEDAIENAPRLDPERREVTAEMADEIEGYWQQYRED
ncbi:PRC-barrel domain-containing protein [Halomonas sediminis]